MALTKIGKEGITGISNSADATFLTATSSEGVTLAGTLAVTGVHTVGTNAVATSDGGAVTTSIVQGLAKHFILQENAGSNTTHNSFNNSSVDDHAAGVIEPKFTANMANANSLVTGGIASGVHNGAVMAPASGGSDAVYEVDTTGYYITIRGITSQSLLDSERYPVSVFGDLA